MPEGHTVHRLAAAFNAQFAGKPVEASSPQGRFAEGAALLDGRVLQAAEAHGKQMFLGFSGDIWLRVHLGLYGMWRFAGDGLEGYGRRTRAAKDAAVEEAFPPEPRGLVRLRLVAGRHVADLSGPTACTMLSSVEKTAFMIWLGEDPLRRDADPARAYDKLRASRTALAALLMRQDIVAGIGNIYRAELLFRHRLEPHQPGRALGEAAWQALWTDLTALLQDGVSTGRIITTEPQDRARKSRRISRDDATYVAHRAGRPCHVCGTPVASEVMAGRTLYWCAHCQSGAPVTQLRPPPDIVAARRGVAVASRKDRRMPQFDATIKHIKDGVKSFTIAAAVKNIEGWEATLEKVESPAAKTIVKDLENLKKHLQADDIKADQIKKLVAKLGKETVTIAGKSDSKNAEKIKALGEALTHAAETDEAA